MKTKLRVLKPFLDLFRSKKIVFTVEEEAKCNNIKQYLKLKIRPWEIYFNSDPCLTFISITGGTLGSGTITTVLVTVASEP